MNSTTKVSIAHFSDVLCIWAYIAQIRVDELKREFGEEIQLDYHFISVFGAVENMMQKNWEPKGGMPAYNQHVLSIANQFDHVSVHSEIWLKNRPASSLSCHLFLKAVQLLENQGVISCKTSSTWFEQLTWEFRKAFFQECVDIADFNAQMAIAEKLGLPTDKIEEKIKNGAAYAALDLDRQLAQTYAVSGSPTFIFNEGRQMLYGNVGYRVIEANVRELIKRPENQASWC